MTDPTMQDPKLQDEAGRIEALRRYDVLDTPREEAFDKITNLVRTILQVPISAVSLIDTDRQWFKSLQGLDGTETERRVAFCDHTIRSREAMVVPDARLDDRFMANPLVTGAPGICSYAGVPLMTPDGYNVGALCAVDTVARQFTPEQMEILKSFGALVIDELELRRIAQHDHLTGVLNRRAFTAEAEKEIARLLRYGHPAALVLFDIDHFKTVNDTHGHPAGDAVLKAVATCCTATLRPNDCFGRLGGEEFAVLLPETAAPDAYLVAERLRNAIAGMPIDGTPGLTVTASFGIAAFAKETGTLDAWLQAADTALYAAKHAGRNRSVIADPPSLASLS